ADHDERQRRTAPRRFATLHPAGQGYVRNAGWTHARGARQGLVRRELVAGWRQQGHVDRQRGGQLMLSCVAERVYWLGRYLERVENAARLINVYSQMLFDLPTGSHLGWGILIDITGC